MRVLVDRHHADLYHALQLTLEDRLGMAIYTPIGREWWDEGYWRFGSIYGDDRLVRQYLEGGGWTPVPGWTEGGYCVTRDSHHPGRDILGVSLAHARTLGWDLVIATVEENQPGFARFAREHGARFAVHVGNANQYVDYDLDPIVLGGVQAFDHAGTFRYREPVRTDVVTSFVNLLPLIPDSWGPFEELAHELAGTHTFRSFGHACPDGFRDPASAVADEMAEAGWAYHDKPTGDGFGHVIHDWAAVGRPLIGHARFYRGQLGEHLWRDGETCIDLDRHSIEDAARIVRETSPERHAQMCRAIRAEFEAHYDPDAQVRGWRDLLEGVPA